MSEDQEAQEDELLALESIYDQSEFRRNKYARGGEVHICPDLPHDFKVIVKSGGNHTEYRVSFLPPLVLNFEFPVDYPSTSSPLFSLSCKWLSHIQLAAVSNHLDKLWQESLGSVILFSWIQFLSNEVLSFLHILSPFELPLQAEGGSTGDSEERAEEIPAALTQKEYLDPRAVLQGSSQTNVLLQVLSFDQVQRQRVFDRQVFDCGVCLSQKLGSDCHFFTECKHVYCKVCMSEYFRVRIKEGTIQNLNCPESGCTSAATPMQVKLLVGEELFDRYDRLLLQSSLDSMDDVVYCPRRTCATAVMVEPDSTTAMCPACRYAFCTLCRRGNHGLSHCKGTRGKESATEEEKKQDGKQAIQTMMESLNEQWLAVNSKECPHCSFSIEKNGGCNIMTCTNCNRSFCWKSLILL